MGLTYNNNNWGFNFMKKRSDKNLQKIMIFGCNQQVRMNFQTGTYEFTIMAIPRDYVNGYIFSKTPGFGLINFVSLINSFGFTCEYLSREQAEKLGVDTRLNSSNSYNDIKGNSVRTIDLDDYEYVYIPALGNSKLPYYTFCALRILYYTNENTVTVLKSMIKQGIETVTAKDFLSLCLAYHISGSNHVVPPTGSVKNEINPCIDAILRDDTARSAISQATFVIPAELAKVNFDDFYKYPKPYRLVPTDVRRDIEKGLFYLMSESNESYYYIPKVAGKTYVAAGPKTLIVTSIKCKSGYSGGTTVNCCIYRTPYEEVMKKPVMTMARVLSRHPSHNVFRKNPQLTFPAPVLIRLGSTTVVPAGKYAVEINSIPSIQTSANKFLMKRAFDAHNVPTADWYLLQDGLFVLQNGNNSGILPEELPFPIIMKNIFGSRGEGNTKVDNVEQLNAAIKKAVNLKNYIFEKFYNYAKEYRIHVSESGPFLVWRKLRRAEVPQEKRWFFNSETCNWISPANKSFDMPVNMDYVYKTAVQALRAVGLTIGGVDLRIQSKGASPKFIVVEINSACAQAEQTSEAYIREFQNIVNANLR